MTLTFQEAVKKHGADSVTINIHMDRKRNLLNWALEDHHTEKVECRIDETDTHGSQYFIKDNYKVRLTPINEDFHPHAFYIRDLQSILDGGYAEMIINA